MPMKENISSKSKVGQRKIVNDMQSLIYSLHFLEKKKVEIHHQIGEAWRTVLMKVKVPVIKM